MTMKRDEEVKGENVLRFLCGTEGGGNSIGNTINQVVTAEFVSRVTWKLPGQNSGQIQNLGISCRKNRIDFENIISLGFSDDSI